MQIADFVERFSRPGEEAAEVRWAECSLRNGFGLKLIHRYLAFYLIIFNLYLYLLFGIWIEAGS